MNAEELREYVNEKAEECIENIHQLYENALDYSVESLTRLDNIIDENRAMFLSLGKSNIGRVTVCSACYLYKICENEFGGVYKVLEEAGPIILLIGEPENEIQFSIFESVLEFVKEGTMPNLSAMYQGLKQKISRDTL